MKQIPKIKLGSTGREVSRLGFGGGWIIEDEGVKEGQAIKIVQEAIRLGINYFDTASSYGKGDSERRNLELKVKKIINDPKAFWWRKS